MTRNSEAIRLAEASDWEGLLRLIELAPELAAECGDYGMLPIHWACTEAHVPAALLDRLLAAYPDGARTKNAVHLLPLHIAIRACMSPHLLHRLLAANPLAAREPTPEGLSTIELAKYVGGFSDEAMKLLLDASGTTPEQDNNKSDSADNDSSANAKELSVVGGPERVDLLESHDESGFDAFVDDDDHEWTHHDDDSSLVRSLSLVSDSGSLDGHLVSPSSTSTSSQAQSPSSANSAPMPLAPPLHKQMQGPFQRKHSLDYHYHAVAAAAASARASQSQSQDPMLARRSRTQLQTRPAPASLGGRHQSLPVIPTFEAAWPPHHLQYPPAQPLYDNRPSEDDDKDEIDKHSRRHYVEPPPEWKHDDECALCHVSFSVFKHRHHCRNCGQSICSQHSADRKVPLATKGFSAPQRVCVTCYAGLTRTHHRRATSELDAVLDAAGLGGAMNPVAAFARHQQLQLASPGSGGREYHSPTDPSAGRWSRRSQLVTRTNDGGLESHVNDLRRVVTTQQHELEALAQSNLQLQQQVLEQEELKAETMLLITQLMTRVSVLELQKHANQPDDDGNGGELERERGGCW